MAFFILRPSFTDVLWREYIPRPFGRIKTQTRYGFTRISQMDRL
jgi:hypothetical protein